MSARRTVTERISTARHEGIAAGRMAALEELKRSRGRLENETLEAKVRLINAVGQALDAQTRLLSGLAHVFDNGPR